MRVAASVKQPSRSRAPSTGAAALHPLQGERQTRPSSAEFGEGSSAHPASGYAEASYGRQALQPTRPLPASQQRKRPLFLPLPMGEGRGEGLPGTHPWVTQRAPVQSTQGAAALHPLRGERQIPPSAAEIGEGSSGHPASGYPKVSCGRQSLQSRNRSRPRPSSSKKRPRTRRRPAQQRLTVGPRLRPGGLAAPEGGFVPLLPLGPDGVGRPSSHEARRSIPSVGGRHVTDGPRAGIQPAVADCGSRAPLAPHLARPPFDTVTPPPPGQRALGALWPRLRAAWDPPTGSRTTHPHPHATPVIPASSAGTQQHPSLPARSAAPFTHTTRAPDPAHVPHPFVASRSAVV